MIVFIRFYNCSDSVVFLFFSFGWYSNISYMIIYTFVVFFKQIFPSMV
jgi:hypothetical protein